MSRNKKIYWMKFPLDFFDNDVIQWLKEQPNGEKYALFYIELCLKSAKTDGILIRSIGDMLIPYNAEMLGKMTNTEVEVVVVALELLKQAKLVEILENGELYLSAVENMLGWETDRAASMRRLRAERAAALGNIVTPQLPESYLDIDIDIDKDKESGEKTKRSFAPPSVEDVENYCKEKGYKTVNAMAFVAFYESKGWKVGKDKMKNWKSAVAGWEARNQQTAPAPAVRPAAAKTNDALEKRRQMMGG